MANYSFQEVISANSEYTVEVSIGDSCYKVGSVVDLVPDDANPQGDLKCLTFIVDYEVNCQSGNPHPTGKLEFLTRLFKNESEGENRWIIIYDSKSNRTKNERASVHKLADTKPAPK